METLSKEWPVSSGCIGGAGCLTHGEKNKMKLTNMVRKHMKKTISEAISVLKLSK